MNKIINTIGAGFRLMVCTCLAFLLIPACTNETQMITDTDTNAPLQVSASVKSMAVTKADDSKPAAAGTYYMGYNKKGGGADTINLTVQNGGNVDPQSILGKTWSLFQNSNPLQNTPFTLDNVADVNSISGTYDVLWGKTTGWSIPLNFVLDHKMSKLTIQLTTEPTDIDLTSATVTLTNMATTVASYARATGVITAGSQNQTISSFTAGDTDAATLTSTVILPPQKRQSAMKLNVVVGSNTFESSLPNGMVYDGSSKQLEFLSGYHLTITAKLVKSGADNRILFTNATLENWIDVGTGSVTAKEAGIYNATDLTAWIKAHNDSPQDEKVLERYGKKDVDGVWTFSIWKNITLPAALISKIQNFGTNNLDGHGYTITDGVATDKNLLFEATLPGNAQLKNITIGTTKYN